MAEISAGMVKDLREKTGAGMMDCKSALGETKGDMEAAVDWLRKKGLAKAAKKAGRVAAEGLVGVAAHDGAGAVVEVNSETDFVARNDQFQNFVAKVSELALKANGDIEALKKMPYPGASTDVAGHLAALVGQIGENMTLRRTAALQVSPGIVASYVHNQAAPGLGRQVVLVALKSSGNSEKLAALGRDVAMHVAAMNPLAVDATGVDQAVVAREKAIFEDQSRASGKPENVIAKMVEGRLRKFFEESTLLKQPFVKNPDQTIEALLKAAEKDVGGAVTVVGFVRFALGDGIQKEETDFAAEVAAAAKS
ncbi:MAG: elongation factor Ts [Alphaproteobacteria bacterium]|nr:elongation factor Ts [Alphaproteobacteria bacterium]